METREVVIGGTVYKNGVVAFLPADHPARRVCVTLVWGESYTDIVNAHSRHNIGRAGFDLLDGIKHVAGVRAVKMTPEGELYVGVSSDSCCYDANRLSLIGAEIAALIACSTATRE